jgi:hypothetical protein
MASFRELYVCYCLLFHCEGNYDLLPFYNFKFGRNLVHFHGICHVFLLLKPNNSETWSANCFDYLN